MKQHVLTIAELLSFLTSEAKKYRKKALSSIERNKHMNNLSQKNFLKLKKNRRLFKKMIDAVLVDFINDVGASQCVDYALYTKYLDE